MAMSVLLVPSCCQCCWLGSFLLSRPLRRVKVAMKCCPFLICCWLLDVVEGVDPPVCLYLPLRTLQMLPVH